MNGNLNNALLLTEQVLSQLETGFVRCESCGDQEETSNLDFVSDIHDIRAELMVMLKREEQRAIMSADPPGKEQIKFMVGQRVILNNEEICIVLDTPRGSTENPNTVWLKSIKVGYHAWYSKDNVKPLPNGQL